MLPPLSKHMLPFLSMYWISTQSYGTALALYTSGKLCFLLWRSFLMRLRPLSLAMCSGDSVFRCQSRMQYVFPFFYQSLGPPFCLPLLRLSDCSPSLSLSPPQLITPHLPPSPSRPIDMFFFSPIGSGFPPPYTLPVQSNHGACLHVVWLVSTGAVEGSLDLLESLWSVLLRRCWCRGVDDRSSAHWSMPVAVMNGRDPASGLVVLGWSVQVVCRGGGARLRF